MTRIAKNISFPNPRGPVAATHIQLLEQGHEDRCLICTPHFLSPLKCSSILHFQSLQRKNSNVSFLLPLNGHCSATKNVSFENWWFKKKNPKKTRNCLCTVFFSFPVSEITAPTIPSQRQWPSYSHVYIQSPNPWQDIFLTLLPFPGWLGTHGSPRAVSAVLYFTPSDSLKKGVGVRELPETQGCSANNTICCEILPGEDCVSKGQQKTRHQR